MKSLRVLIPLGIFCSYCADECTPAPPEKYRHNALICRHKYGYNRRQNTIKDTLAQVAFRRCRIIVIHEPPNLWSTPISMTSSRRPRTLPTTLLYTHPTMQGSKQFDCWRLLYMKQLSNTIASQTFLPISIAIRPFSMSNPIPNWDRRLQFHNQFRLAIRRHLKNQWYKKQIHSV